MAHVISFKSKYTIAYCLNIFSTLIKLLKIDILILISIFFEYFIYSKLY